MTYYKWFYSCYANSYIVRTDGWLTYSFTCSNRIVSAINNHSWKLWRKTTESVVVLLTAQFPQLYNLDPENFPLNTKAEKPHWCWMHWVMVSIQSTSCVLFRLFSVAVTTGKGRDHFIMSYRSAICSQFSGLHTHWQIQPTVATY